MIPEAFEDQYRESLSASIPPEHRAKKRWPSPPPQLAQQRAHAPRAPTETEDRMESAALPEPIMEPEPAIMKEVIAVNNQTEAPAPPAPAPVKPRRRWSEAQKAAILSELAELGPGVTVAEVARRNGVNFHTLSAWYADSRKAARQRGNGVAAPAAIAIDKPQGIPQGTALTVREPPPPAVIEVELPQGKLRIPSAANREAILAVVDALLGRSCPWIMKPLSGRHTPSGSQPDVQDFRTKYRRSPAGRSGLLL